MDTDFKDVSVFGAGRGATEKKYGEKFVSLRSRITKKIIEE